MPQGGSLAAELRVADPDRYLSALYAPPDRREDLVALYAFNAEIAGIRDRIRDALPGEIRIQWWRDVLAGAKPGERVGHPVADALIAVMLRRQMPSSAFDNMLDARIFDLYNDPMPSRTDLEGYCGDTGGALIQLASMILDGEAARRVAELAGHAGCAVAMTGMLRMLPLHRARGQCFVPRDLLAAAGTTPEEFVGGGSAAPAIRAIDAMTALAVEHLQRFSGQAAALPEVLRPAFLPLAIVPPVLARLAKMGPRLLNETADVPAWRKQWAMFRAASRGW